MAQSDYGTGILTPNVIRRQRLPRAQTFSVPKRTADVYGGETAAPMASSAADYPTAAADRQFTSRHGTTVPLGPAITPGAGAYSDVGPGDPAGYLSAPYSSAYPFGGLQDLARYLIRAGGQEGVFQPGYLRNLLRNRALQNAAGQRRRGDLLGQLAGLDPAQMREAIVNNDISASEGLAGALNQADLADAMQYQDFIRSLLASERGGESNYFTQRDLMRLQDQLQGGGFGDWLGQTLGSAAGALIPGAGSLVHGGRGGPAEDLSFM